MSTQAVELDQVTKRFGDVVAVDRLDLAIADGEFFSLLGPSGCGKTTTLRMIAGLEYPTEGRIAIFGEDMGLRPPNERPVNTVFQSYALFPHMTVEENVAFGLRMRKVPKAEIAERVRRAIDLVRLTGLEGRRPSQLSGGQQQRVALARALVNEPKVLLLDEPLGALDLKLRQAMQLELKDLQERVGITFVYVTHDQEEALTMSDRIGVMHAGRLLQVGTPEEIYERPTSRFVADFIGETNLLEGDAVPPAGLDLGGIVVPADLRGRSGHVTVAVRPEKVELVAPDEGVEGTVVRSVYLGSTVMYDVEVAGRTIRVRHENRPDLERHVVGDRVGIRWPAEAAPALED